MCEIPFYLFLCFHRAKVKQMLAFDEEEDWEDEDFDDEEWGEDEEEEEEG